MRKILIFVFVLIFISFVSASGLYPVSMADFIYPTCNNNGRCDYFENSKDCPSDCKVTQNNNLTANENNYTTIETSTTTSETSTSSTTLSNINDIQQNDQGQNNGNGNQENIGNIPVGSGTTGQRSISSSWILILSIGFAIMILLLIIILYLWIKEKPNKSVQGKSKVRIIAEEDEFGLPGKPRRGFGV